MALSVFTIHDDPVCDVCPEERWWAAIAAEDEQQAIALAACVYNGDGPLNEMQWKDFFAVAQHIDCSEWPSRYRPTHPSQLTDLESLRECRFREEGEDYCDACGRASLGITQYHVCGECRQCNECGCECEMESDQ